MSCIGYAVRHTASISSVAISQISTKFFTTVAQDLCLKLWELSQINNLESHGKYDFLNKIKYYRSLLHSILFEFRIFN